MKKSSVLKLPDRKAIEDEACSWLIRLDGDEPVTTAQIDELLEWLRRSPAHREALQQLSVLWDRMDVLTDLAVPLGRDFATEKASGYRNRLAGSWSRTSIAMVALVAAAGILFTISRLQSPAEDMSHIANGVHHTSIGEQSTLHLADGSIVQLNTDTQIEVDYDHEGRNIRLERGEAHFKVAHDPTLPFTVFADGGIVRAAGTAFAVRLMDHQILVTVSEGRVDLAGADSARAAIRARVSQSTTTSAGLGSLDVGQSIRFNGRTREAEPVRTLAEPELQRRLAWREGWLKFSGESLQDVIAEVGRYTDMSVSIVDPEIRQLKVGGKFRIGETGALFDVLQSNFGVEIRRIAPHRVELASARN